MKIIKCLSDFIEGEIDAAKHYIEKALKYKDSNPDVAEIFYSLSNEEMRHVNILHDEVTKAIQKYRLENGEPPEKMMFLYEYLHEKHIECAKKVKIMQAMFKE